MASRKKSSSKFGIASGRHRRKRKALGLGRKRYQFSCHFKDSSPENVVIIKRTQGGKKRRLRNKRALKRFYQLYRSGVTGQLQKRYVRKYFSTTASGYRFVNLGSLQEHISDISLHSATCKKAIELGMKGISPIELVSEVDTFGLASVLATRCKGCHREILLNTSPKLNVDRSSRHFDINVRAVWGTLVTGNGQAHLNEFLATTDSPGLTQNTFSKIESDINHWWNEILQDELKKAIEEERQIAISKESFHEGVPSVTVICDGGWSKRTHKHSYNAMGGVGVIIGAETKKLLHIGVRNKYCYVCQRAENVGCKPKPHECFKNWSLSSQAMEADIIIEGFLKADKLGVRYMNIIADGDSSVYARIREEVPVWGCHVKKAECANHVCKCLRGSLEKLVDDNPSYKGRGNLSKATRVRLTSAVRCAIRMRSNQKKKNAAKLLEKDIRNSVHHIFGNHNNCSSDFCKVKQGDSKKHVTTDEADNDDEIEENDILNDQIKLWCEGSSIEDQEESRRGTDTICSNKKLMNDISVLLNRVAVKSERLIGNFTTNLAECWMHIRSKFDGGKVFNHCSRGSWHTRCFAGGLRFNEGPKWSRNVWEKVTGTAAGEIFESLYEKREKCIENNTRSKSTKESKLKRWKRKSKLTRESNSKKAKSEYGKAARDVEPDVCAGELNKKMEQFIQKEVNVNENEIKDLEEQTKSQSECKLWKNERKKRITASNFGCVCKRNPKVKVAPLVRSMLYSRFKGTKFTQLGLNNEALAIKEYIERKRLKKEIVKVEKMGLIICTKEPYLAGSPDGKVIYQNGDCGLLEIKNILYNKPLSLSQGATMKSVKNFCLEINQSTGILQLKKSHHYYYQCQGLLYVCKLPWIDFVVRTEHPYELHIERIVFNDKLWSNEMFPKLKAFYFKALLPELALPRNGKSPGIREPGLWYEVEKIVKKQKHADGSEIPTQRSTSETTGSTAGTSADRVAEATLEVPSTSTSRRSGRHHKLKFVGRRISHLWNVDENATKWYTGTVLSVIRGRDGDDDAIYEVRYDGDDEIYELENLSEDLRGSQLKFIDI